MLGTWRRWLPIDRAWVECRDAAQRAPEDAMIAAARGPGHGS